MMDTLNPMLQWLNLHPNWAALATFIISAGESIAIIGTLVPGTLIMTAIGTLAGAGVIELIPTLIAAILGAIVGDGISYLLGHHFKDRIRLIWPFRKNPQWLEKGELFFHKHGAKSVFIGRFVGPVRAIVPVIAGMLGMKPVKFYIANIFSAIGWAPAYMLPGIILGAVSLELPPDIAVHAILKLLLVTLFIFFCLWTTFEIFSHIGYRIDKALNTLWEHLQKSRYARSITIILKHHNPAKTHGQLVLAFYFIMVMLSFLYLAHHIAIDGPSSNFLNNGLYHFFRSMRSPTTDNVALLFTLLGEKTVLLPVISLIFGWLIFTKRTYLAWHVFLLGIFTIGSVEIIKHIVHSPRPWGIPLSTESYSFPSGHTTLATAFSIGFALLISQAFPSKRRYIIYAAVVLILLVSLSRLYLGAHWFTDVVAGWLLGIALIMLVTLSYNRQKDPNHVIGKIATVILTIYISIYAFTCFHSFNHYKQLYTLQDYPTQTMASTAWWKQSDAHIPIYRINRFGLSSQVLNLQWIGNLDAIEKILLTNNWEIPPERDWITIVLRITDIQSSENVPLVSPLHLDKKPKLVLVHYNETDNRVMILRLWKSNIHLEPSQDPLWVGTVGLIPRTYNWIFKKNSDDIAISPAVLFPKKIPTHYETKKIFLSPSQIAQKYKVPPTILLLKPKP